MVVNAEKVIYDFPESVLYLKYYRLPNSGGGGFGSSAGSGIGGFGGE